MNIMAIPKRLLTDSATLLIPVGKNNFDVEYKSVRLENVRVCFSRKTRLGSGNEIVSGGGTLYFDAKNSSPKGTVLDTDMRLAVNGRRYRIARVTEAKGENGTHHYEAAFV